MTTVLSRPQSSGTPSLAPVQPPSLVEKPARLVSLDAYRGFFMLLMASGGLAVATVAKAFPQDANWQFLAFHTSHVPWMGCAFWDLIQPAFMFMVGVAMPYSHASRKARGDSESRIGLHVVLRSLILIWLGIFLRSMNSPATNFTFNDVLTQIGLGYSFVYLALGRGLRLQLIALVAILIGSWAMFAIHPVPGPGFNHADVGVPEGPWLTGFWQHWDKNTNAAASFDQWFLNLFPRFPDDRPFTFQGGGYQTLNFVPSMATMLLGLMAGELLRGPKSHRNKFIILVAAGGISLGLGLLAGATVCPIVKRIWTPSWVLYSGAWVLWMLAGFYLVIDVWGWQKWAFPLVVVGMNSIAMYCMVDKNPNLPGLLKGWISSMLQIHTGTSWHPGVYGPIIERSAVLFILWLICLWMYQRKLFIRI